MKQIVTHLVVVLLISGCNSLPEKQTTIPPKEATTRPSVPDKPKPVVQRPPTCCGTTPSRSCGDFNTPVNQALQAKNLDELAGLLVKLKRQADCSVDYLKKLKRNMSDIAAAKARDFVQRGQLAEAEKWLQHKYAPVNSWTTQDVRGEIATKHKQWKKAAVFYNNALDLINNPKVTVQKPSPAEIERVQKLAIETQLVAGTLIQIIGTKTNPIPVKFVFAKSQFTKDGKNSAKKLAHYLKQQNPKQITQITLIGHTDRIGSDAYNCELSKKRANALKKYLVDKGIHANITTIGKGKREPFKLYDPTRYTQQEIDQINRRVEFIVDGEVSYVNACQ